jgi:hypothetical protein
VCPEQLVFLQPGAEEHTEAEANDQAAKNLPPAFIQKSTPPGRSKNPRRLDWRSVVSNCLSMLVSCV